jgi:hypothetical protein
LNLSREGGYIFFTYKVVTWVCDEQQNGQMELKTTTASRRAADV